MSKYMVEIWQPNSYPIPKTCGLKKVDSYIKQRDKSYGLRYCCRFLDSGISYKLTLVL